MPYVSSSNFNKNNGKKKVHPIVPLIFVVALAVLLMGICAVTWDIVADQQAQIQSIYDEQNAAQ